MFQFIVEEDRNFVNLWVIVMMWKSLFIFTWALLDIHLQRKKISYKLLNDWRSIENLNKFEDENVIDFDSYLHRSISLA